MARAAITALIAININLGVLLSTVLLVFGFFVLMTMLLLGYDRSVDALEFRCTGCCKYLARDG
jgi:hypothetical protein